VSLDESTGGRQPVPVSERLADHRPSPENEYRESELSTRLTHLHSQLSPTLRRTFLLRDVDGLSIRETARILGVPTGTVKAQSARARKRLTELMRRTLRPRSRRLPNRLLRFANSAVHPGAPRETHMVRELLVDNESDHADVLVEADHETVR
jgi:predicted RNA polymerase sigma factor